MKEDRFEVRLPKSRHIALNQDDFFSEEKKLRSGKKDDKADALIKENFFVITLKEIDELTFTMCQSLTQKGKEVEATKLCLKELHVGGDNIEDVLANFSAVRAGMSVVHDLVAPLEVELKKK